MLYAQIHLTLPAWVHEAVDSTRACASDTDKVGLAIELSAHNIEAQTGGPFGAAVFGPDDRIIAVGVNRVVPHACSVAHAEMMAYMLAQSRTQRLRLNRDADDNAIGPITLATSSQPCCQCYGATVWAGIDRLLIGARAEDVMLLTEFDEGPLPQDWVGELNTRGIDVVRDIQRDAACTVLRSYGEQDGQRY
ncbi:MAG: nucleoside deaminase [Thermomonas sp.]